MICAKNDIMYVCWGDDRLYEIKYWIDLMLFRSRMLEDLW